MELTKVHVRFPESFADAYAIFVGTNTFVTLLSWTSKKKGLFEEGSEINAILAFPPDKADLVKYTLEKYFVKK